MPRTSGTITRSVGVTCDNWSAIEDVVSVDAGKAAGVGDSPIRPTAVAGSARKPTTTPMNVNRPSRQATALPLTTYPRLPVRPSRLTDAANVGCDQRFVHHLDHTRCGAVTTPHDHRG